MRIQQAKTAIVTGANRGIGLAIAKRLARDGARCVLCARDQALLDSAVAQIKSEGGMAAAISLDLRTPDSGQKLVQFTIDTFGEPDLLVNNAGATKRGELTELTEQDWVDGFNLKLFGAVRVTRAAWPYLKTRSGSVVNISGTGGRTPGAQFAIGGSVNAGLLSFTKAIAEAGIRDGVQVNAINPGAIRTDRFARRMAVFAAERNIDAQRAEQEFVAQEGMTRIGTPEDVAALVAYMVSSEARFLHGAFVDLDGGATKTL
jgi:NAD(P)-dependent dehydrogenase (short-subunit alcohol dehydrogenase family)